MWVPCTVVVLSRCCSSVHAMLWVLLKYPDPLTLYLVLSFCISIFLSIAFFVFLPIVAHNGDSKSCWQSQQKIIILSSQDKLNLFKSEFVTRLLYPCFVVDFVNKATTITGANKCNFELRWQCQCISCWTERLGLNNCEISLAINPLYPPDSHPP